MAEPITLWTVIPPFIGGFGGAYFVYKNNKKQLRLNRSLEILNGFEQQIEEIEKSYSILKYCQTPEGKVFYVPETPIDEEARQVIEKDLFDTVVKAGDFLNKVAYLYLNYGIDRKLFSKTTPNKLLKNFIHLLGNFQLQDYDLVGPDPETEYTYMHWSVGWPFLHLLSKKDRDIKRCLINFFL